MTKDRCADRLWIKALENDKIHALCSMFRTRDIRLPRRTDSPSTTGTRTRFLSHSLSETLKQKKDDPMDRPFSLL